MCDEGWSGEWCQVPSCPNDCFGNGECSVDSDGVYMCQCDNQYTGEPFPTVKITIDCMCVCVSLCV